MDSITPIKLIESILRSISGRPGKKDLNKNSPHLIPNDQVRADGALLDS
jgi:hypothetical protein